MPSPNPSTPNSLLRGFALVSATKIWALGFDVVTGPPVIEHWIVKRWNIVSNPNPSPNLSFLNGAAADLESGHAWAAGAFFIARGSQTLAEFCR